MQTFMSVTGEKLTKMLCLSILTINIAKNKKIFKHMIPQKINIQVNSMCTNIYKLGLSTLMQAINSKPLTR